MEVPWSLASPQGKIVLHSGATTNNAAGMIIFESDFYFLKNRGSEFTHTKLSKVQCWLSPQLRKNYANSP